LRSLTYPFMFTFALCEAGSLPRLRLYAHYAEPALAPLSVLGFGGPLVAMAWERCIALQMQRRQRCCFCNSTGTGHLSLCSLARSCFSSRALRSQSPLAHREGVFDRVVQSYKGLAAGASMPGGSRLASSMRRHTTPNTSIPFFFMHL